MSETEPKIVIPVAELEAAFDEREKAQLIHALMYEKFHSKSGIPGHGQFMLIAKLCHLLQIKVQQSWINS